MWQTQRGVILSERPPVGSDFLKKEWLFLCASVAPAGDAEHFRNSFPRDLNWNVVLDLAEKHAVLGILAKRLLEIGFHGVPPEARERLQERMRAQHLFTLSMTAELFHVLDDLAAADIQVIVIKGPVTSQVAHNDPAVRGFGDIDLLLLQKDIQRASRTMQQQGFAADVADFAIQAGKVPGEYVFKRPGTSRMVEIHTERTFRYYPEGMPIEEMFQRRRTILLEGREVPALGLPDEVVFHCVHGAKDFWERLMWVADVAGFVAHQPQMNWQEAWSIAEATGSERMLRTGVLLAARVLRIKLPGSIEKRIQQDAASERLCEQIQAWLPYGAGAPPSLRRRALYRISMAGGGVVGLKYLSRLSLSPTEEDWKEGEPQYRSWLWDAVRRPFRLMRKYGSEE